jgi:hypothetical protein
MTWAIPIEAPELQRRRLNAILAEIEALKPGFAASLPDPAGQPEGRYFTRTSDQTLHQLQSGAWVEVSA